MQTWNNNGSEPVQNWLRAIFLKTVLMLINFISMLIEEFKKNCPFVTFEKSKKTSLFNENKASMLSYITRILTDLPEKYIPLL